MRVLIAGESWMTHSIHVKGFDSFTTSSYHEGVGPLRTALERAGHAVTYLPNHRASDAFPLSAADLGAFEVVMLSDIGANTLLLPDRTFSASERTANRLILLREYVQGGGGLLMVGGYLTFQGIEGKGAYHGTPVEEVLPVTLQAVDDRVESPQGVVPEIVQANHPILKGLTHWPHFLGYNRSQAKPAAQVLAKVGADPFIAVMECGKGRSGIFASDCGPHWGPPAFLEWAGYQPMWDQLVRWLGRGL
jgi:uncharacterized membrane protein